MHDIRWIRDNPEAFDHGLARRGLAAEAARLIAIDERRRAIIRVLEGAQSRRNAASKEIGQAKARNDEATVERLMAEVDEFKTSISAMEAEQKAAQKELNDALPQIPNQPLDEVPDGRDEHGNVEHHKFGAKRDYAFTPRQHFELGEALGQMDFETATKLSGSRFVVLKRGLARMERALGQFMLDLHTNEHGYAEIAPPLLVKDDVMFGTAQLPKFENDQFWTIGGRIFRTPRRWFPRRHRPVDRCLGTTNGLHAKPGRIAAKPSRAHPNRGSPAHQSGPRVRSSTRPSCRCASPR